MERKVELLAPAGNYESFLGAMHAGADAVYLGGEKFGARAYARNFSRKNYAVRFDMRIFLIKKCILPSTHW